MRNTGVLRRDALKDNCPEMLVIKIQSHHPLTRKKSNIDSKHPTKHLTSILYEKQRLTVERHKVNCTLLAGGGQAQAASPESSAQGRRVWDIEPRPSCGGPHAGDLEPAEGNLAMISEGVRKQHTEGSFWQSDGIQEPNGAAIRELHLDSGIRVL
ncbi:hypothetical protein H920_10528 [Fukomys damarensis]|uniref:Uncharacterized protein n=1 Tax=Fukomys damarensis TaxID=885580 RepID=A0A091D7S6_FUKDA|nr:hypothetical protein H920_10528 [Fukomys damarensis]